MDYSAMSKEQLIDHLEKLREERAFTYEDRMKLLILDHSPFTVWASDRDCIIKLWMGQCEALYGYSSREAIGKDYVDLFVAEDEKIAARRDQIEIVDNDKVFHNIANDVAKNGNSVQLITNCRRIQDPDTGEFWNAEMALVVNYFEEEKELLRGRIEESQRIKASIAKFIENKKKVQEEFERRKSLVNDSMRKCEENATRLRKRTECKAKIAKKGPSCDSWHRIWRM